MPDANERILSLLGRFVDLQVTANESRRRALATDVRYYAEARQRTGQAIGLQQAAVARQRWFVRVWLGVNVVVAAIIAGLL